MATAADIVKQLRKDHGDEIASMGAKFLDCPRLPTGIFPFDLASGGGFPMGKMSIVFGPESSGKCHAWGDSILMADGTTKEVQYIKKGDSLMGVDSSPRTVTGVGSGFGQLYEITPVKGGGTFTVNGDHQLHLVCTHDQGYRKKGDLVQISVKDYLQKSKDWKIYHHLYRVGVEFPEKKLSIDPYFLGLWLGDGSSSNMQVYSVSTEIIDWLQEYADSLGGSLSVYDRESPCPGYAIVGTTIREAMRDLGLFNQKHIPQRFLINSRENRLRLLAGLIDTDGAKGSGSSCVFYSAQESLCKQVQWLAQSLGYYASTSFKKTSCSGKQFDSWYVYISMDDPSELPLLLEYKRPEVWKRAGSCLTSRFTVTPVKEGAFYGFEVDGDHLYLTDGFIVNHNTNLALMAIAKGQLLYPDKVAVFIDIENAYNSEWAEMLGVDNSRVIHVQPDYAEQVVDIAEGFLHASDVFCVVVDSVAALITSNEIKNSAETAVVGGASLVVGKLVRKATRAQLQARKTTGFAPALICINQIRLKIGVMFGDPETQPGGNALRFASSFTVRVYGKNIIEKSVNAVMPLYKETSLVIKKWKMPILAVSSVYRMQTLTADGHGPGFVKDWNTISTYLKELDYLSKAGSSGWVMMGETYKTLGDCEAALYSNPAMLQEVKSTIIAELLAQGSIAPPDSDGEIPE